MYQAAAGIVLVRCCREMDKRKKKRQKRQKGQSREDHPVAGLVIGGITACVIGIAMIVHPVAYVSMGGIGPHGSRLVTTIFSGNEPAFVGVLIVFMGGFVLAVATHIKRS